MVFRQCAAAGFVSSLIGSAAQGIGIHGWGMVGVSAASGGVGAAIAGGKAEEILSLSTRICSLYDQK